MDGKSSSHNFVSIFEPFDRICYPSVHLKHAKGQEISIGNFLMTSISKKNNENIFSITALASQSCYQKNKATWL